MRRPVLALFTAALLATTSCASDIIDALDGEPDVATMRITIGAQTITFNSAGTVTGGPIILGAGSTVNVSATFLTVDGVPDPNVTQAAFQLNVSSGGSVAFQRSNVNPFTGTLTAGGTGSSQLSFALYDLESQQNVFGPWPVLTVVN